MPKLRLKLIPTSYTEDTMDMPDGEDGLDTLDYHTVLTDILDTHMLLDMLLTHMVHLLSSKLLK